MANFAKKKMTPPPKQLLFYPLLSDDEEHFPQVSGLKAAPAKYYVVSTTIPPLTNTSNKVTAHSALSEKVIRSTTEPLLPFSSLSERLRLPSGTTRRRTLCVGKMLWDQLMAAGAIEVTTHGLF